MYMLSFILCYPSFFLSFFSFFFNDASTIDIYTLSLHDALPIYSVKHDTERTFYHDRWIKLLKRTSRGVARICKLRQALLLPRSEEHTSELQLHSDLVCRLLLEKKKKKKKKQLKKKEKRYTCRYA